MTVSLVCERHDAARSFPRQTDRSRQYQDWALTPPAMRFATNRWVPFLATGVRNSWEMI